MSSHGPAPEFNSPIVKWIDRRLPVFTMMTKEYGAYPMPRNCNYFWSFGGMAGFVLVMMIATGIFLSMNYTAHVDMAFDSVHRIMRDVQNGWLIRYAHMNGAHVFFIVVYIHMLRGLYYGSYKQPRELLWILGVVILLLMMATAFMGYVLPWGQMSFWGATVITNLFSAVPLIGDNIVIWLWGGFAVDNPTLNRFYSLHYLLPFVIFGVVFLHVAALHVVGSSNPAGIDAKGPQDTVPFHPYMTAKDGLALILFLIFYCALIFFYPDSLGHVDNYIEADPLVTPAHIVPEWYFLPFYAILRAITFDIGIFGVTFIEAKLGGVIAMFGSIAVLFILPWLDTSSVRSANYRPVYKYFFFILVAALVALTICGANPADALLIEGLWGEGEDQVNIGYVHLAQFCTFYYFFHFLILLPVLGKIERPKPLPRSIAATVLHGGGPTPAGAPSKPQD